MTSEAPRQYVPLTCHGHSRPVPHMSFSHLEKEETYYMISACKDGNPMLRDGVTGDWYDLAKGLEPFESRVNNKDRIGTFIGHKGAVWQARLSPDASNAATASADFTAKIWDTHTGEVLYSLQHDHIVRAVAYPPDNSDLVATGGMEKKLRVFDLAELAKTYPGKAATIPASAGFEIGEGVHTSSIKFICWTKDPNIVVTASDKTIRWLDLPSRSCIKHEVLDGEIKSCEVVSVAQELASSTDIGGGKPVLAVSAGKTVYFWGGDQAMDELKRIVLPYSIASVGLDVKGRKLVVGEEPGTWAKVIRYDDGVELDTHKGHHGPIWSIAFSPDSKLYATASEDGTIKMWKNCDGFYGLWRGGATTERSAE
ncbi:WD domain-containing protein [Metarhizium robertsii ARSEF 23]|uniref:Serine-threonine kinase receptor-associated protein n=1 Tax=Metarhizium robertsii (strain ARSEF 23 / ATCC MYA-3075) TaxID=655844 RepID=E9F896_METRA|nr:WD domain-containing protein [Metarhizium robertsii ARSEF 23]EFY96003.2 WD domain-containing protein [Metarhizium robertsii ARSEF 23]